MNSKLLVLALLITWLACHKDADIVVDEEVIDPPAVEVSTKLVSQTDTMVEMARHATQVFAGNVSDYPDFPFLVTHGNLVNRDFELITLTTSDHHQFYHVQSLIENDVNYHHWVLPHILTVEANSATAIEISIHSDYTLHVPANAVLLPDSSPYTGTYTLAYAWMDPATGQANAIPSFSGFDTHRHHALDMTGCFYVSAFTSAGEQLHFATTASIVNHSGQQHRTWLFNSAKATWHPVSTPQHDHINLGKARYYAFADPLTPVRVKGTLEINGRIAPHQQIRITCNAITRTIYTTNKGAWACFLPAQVEITIEVPQPCGEPYTTTMITPDVAEHSVPLSISNTASINSVFLGTFRDNQGAILPEAILLLDGEDETFLYTPGGAFNMNVLMCSTSSVIAQGLDIASGQTGPSVQWQAADTVNMYSVFACEESKDEYLSLTVNGDSKMYWDLKSSVSPQSRVLIEEGSTETDLDLQIAITGMAERAYQDEELNIRFEDLQLGQPGYSLYCPTSPTGCGFATFIITHYPDSSGEWIRGYFDGEFWIKTFQPLTAGYKSVRGEFQVYREF